VNIGGNHRRKDLWEGMVTKIRKGFTRWKGKFISLAGRIWLI